MDELQTAIESLKADFHRGIESFSMEYLEIAGKRWGAVSESETRLVIRGRGEAELLRRRSPGDSAQAPPGRYTGKLSDADLGRLLETLSASGIRDFRAEAPGPRDPVSRLNIRMGGKIFAFSWGIPKKPAPLGMARLEALLIQWTFDACPVADWCLELSAHGLRYQGQALTARLQLQNRGRQSIHIVHPASRGVGIDFGISLVYGEAQLIEDGLAPEPIDLKSISLQWPALSRPELVELKPGHPVSWDFSTELQGSAPRGWIGKISFRHYLAGDSLAGMTVFNGALFTDDLTW
jgi:hypothetical protein